MVLQLTFTFCTEISSFAPNVPQNTQIVRFPKIKILTYEDPIFRQFSQEVSENYIVLAKKEQVHVNIYVYTVTENDTLFSIAARCNIPYETIATLNSISFIDSYIEGKELFIPTASGLFVAEKPQTPLEFLLKTRYSNSNGYSLFGIGSSRFSFIPSAKLSPTERTFFTDSSMTSPLEAGVISSSFGTRISPFTGEQTFHNGTDIAAPIGTPVFASKSGTVTYAGFDNIYGNYIIIQHSNSTQSLYAHLDTLLIKTGAIAEKGEQIGTVGNTGLSTGPHLHFEIKVGSRAQNPASLIKNFLQ